MQIYKNIDILVYKIFFLSFFMIPFISFSQTDLEKIKSSELLILSDFNKILESKNDSLNLKYNENIVKNFYEILTKESSFNYNFDTLKNYVSVLKSEDEKLNVITWNLFLETGTYQYFGFLQYKSSKKETIKIFNLIDKSENITKPETETLTPSNWFGAIYYDLIINKNGKQKYYTLLGWDGNDEFSTKKIIEVLTFTNNENPKFASTFEIEKKITKRIIFEYNKQAQMVLKYSELDKLIIFDHLSPSNPKYEGKYRYYGPDFSNDALQFNKGTWLYIPNIDIKNEY